MMVFVLWIVINIIELIMYVRSKELLLCLYVVVYLFIKKIEKNV